MTTATLPLDYAPPRPSRRRRWLIVMTGMLMLATVAWAAWSHSDRLALQVQVWQDQRVARQYVLPSDLVIYEEQDFAERALPNGIIGCYFGRGLSTGHVELRQAVLDSETADVAFLHERSTPDGHKRIVCVQSVYLDDDGKTFTARAMVFSPGRPWELPTIPFKSDFVRCDLVGKQPWHVNPILLLERYVMPGVHDRIAVELDRGGRVADVLPEFDVPPFRLYAGRPHATEPTAAVFPFECGEAKGELVLRLTDADTLVAEARRL